MQEENSHFFKNEWPFPPISPQNPPFLPDFSSKTPRNKKPAEVVRRFPISRDSAGTYFFRGPTVARRELMLMFELSSPGFSPCRSNSMLTCGPNTRQ